MRRPICYCEPTHACAGEVNTWKFYMTGVALPKETKIKFDLMSKGRNIDWETPKISGNSNTIYALLESGKVLTPKLIETATSIVPQYEFVLPQEVSAEQTFTIVVGSPKREGNLQRTNGTRAQTLAQRRRTFGIYIDPTGKGHYDEPDFFTMDVRGDKLHNIRLTVPSFVSKNKRFDTIVRFEDQYGNLTSNAPEDTLIELVHEHLRENLSWKLFVPETGFLALPNMYFNEPGVYTIVLRNTKTGQEFKASPIKCFTETEHGLFWGLLHGESERFDSTESVENCLRHFRDEHVLNFYGVSPFETVEETSNDTWKAISQNVIDFDENERFSTFLGFQTQGTPKEEGVRHVIFAKEGKALPRRKDPKYSSLGKLYKSVALKELISIPSFTMGDGFQYDFKEFSPEFERVVEIYNAWGSSECTEKEGNRKPITFSGKVGVKSVAEGSIQKALQNNCRFGFVAGGLDDRGVYGDFYNSDQVQYSPGLTAIISKEHTRAALFEALYQRSCYATTGPRIILGIFIAGTGMGMEISSAEKPGLKVNRHLSGYAVGATALEQVEIIRNGKVIHTIQPKSYECNFAWDDMEPLDQVTLHPDKKKPPFVYYYLRVIQQDGHMAWSSPIWIDDEPAIPGKGKRMIKTSAKPALAPVSIPEEEDEDDIDDFDDEDDEDIK